MEDINVVIDEQPGLAWVRSVLREALDGAAGFAVPPAAVAETLLPVLEQLNAVEVTGVITRVLSNPASAGDSATVTT